MIKPADPRVLSKVTRSPESDLLPAATELVLHLGDHVFVFAVRLLEFGSDDPPDTRSPVLP